MFLWQWRRGHRRVLGVMNAQRPANATCNTQQCAMCNVSQVRPCHIVMHEAQPHSVLVIAALSFRLCHKHYIMWLLLSKYWLYTIVSTINQFLWKYACIRRNVYINVIIDRCMCLPLLRNQILSDGDTIAHSQVLRWTSVYSYIS